MYTMCGRTGDDWALADDAVIRTNVAKQAETLKNACRINPASNGELS